MSFVVDKDDDDFSPEDAFNMFTPSIYRPGVKDRSHIDQLDVLAPPGGGDLFTLDAQAVTLSAIGGGPIGSVGSRVPPSVGYGWKLGDNLTQVVLPTPSTDDYFDGGGWILGEREDAILLPVVLTAIGLFAVLGNILLLLTIAGLRRMRSGPNLMLANVALADIVFIAVTVPTAVVNHATKSRYMPYSEDIIGPRVCRFVYYVIFVTVYVTVYTLVVSSVFRFFGQMMRGSSRHNGGHVETPTSLSRGGGGNKALGVGPRGSVAAASAPVGSHGGGSHPVPLSTCSAAVSCAVVWVAFAASHLTFVVQSDVTGLAAFEKPVICVYSPSSSAGLGPSADNTSGAADLTRVRTLWITFLACAFLLPLTIVCCTSAAVLRMQQRAVHGRRLVNTDDEDPSRELGQVGVNADNSVMDNMNNDGRAKREMTTIIMISAIARAICWLPLQIFILIDVFGPEPEPEATADVYRKAEMFGVCMALIGACLGPLIYRIASREFRDAFRLVLRRVCCCSRGSRSTARDHSAYVSSRLVVREPSLVPQSVECQHRIQQRQSPMSSMSSSSCYSHEPHHQHPVHSHRQPPLQQQQQQLLQQHQHQHQQLVNKHQCLNRPDLQLAPVRTSSEVNETIMSIISDSSNHINYT